MVVTARAEDPVATLAQRVIVLANASDPDSVRLANYYAAKRAIPLDNVISLPMPIEETITWPVFVSSVYQPLQDELVKRHWIDAIPTDVKDNVGRTKYVISGHTISYLVVCRGVPLRVENESSLYTRVPPLTDRNEFQTNCGGVDSELSLLAWANYPINAFVPNPLYGNARTTMFQERKVVKVSRLDGPSFSNATALVDSALEAESRGLIGRAYIDLGGKYPAGDVWFESVARQIEEANFDYSVDREPSTFPASARFDSPVLYFGWYANDVSGPFTQPEFHFPTGAVALHLHSFSAKTLSSAHYGWTGPFVARGVTATVGNVYEPYLDLTHQPDLLIRALLNGRTWGDAVYFSLRAVSWQAIAIGDPLYRPFARSFAQQWEHREELPDDSYPYVVLRELRRLERESLPEKSLQLAEDVMKTRASAPVALKWAQLAMAAGKVEVARQAAGWFARERAFKPAEIPLSDEAAQILVRTGESDQAFKIYDHLLGLSTLSREFRLYLLPRGAKVASSIHHDEKAEQWTREAAQLSQGG